MGIDTIASGLHPRIRPPADGSHHTRRSELPLAPRIDGVGRVADYGSLICPHPRLATAPSSAAAAPLKHGPFVR